MPFAPLDPEPSALSSGAIVVEPPGLEPARELVLTSSEFYASGQPGPDGLYTGDVARMEGADPTFVVFDGMANRYLNAPLQVRPDELIRIWVMNAGPTLTNAFHVIGALFDHVYPDGNPTNALNGLQTYNVPPGAGAMFELRIPDEGMYPFVTHAFAYTGRGAVGVIQVTSDAPELPASYPALGDPFIAGQLPYGWTPAVVEGAPGDGAGGHDGPLQIEATIAGFTPSEVEAIEGEIELPVVTLAVGSTVAAIALSADRRHTLVQLGFGMLLAFLVTRLAILAAHLAGRSTRLACPRGGRGGI